MKVEIQSALAAVFLLALAATGAFGRSVVPVAMATAGANENENDSRPPLIIVGDLHANANANAIANNAEANPTNGPDAGEFGTINQNTDNNTSTNSNTSKDTIRSIRSVSANAGGSRTSQKAADQVKSNGNRQTQIDTNTNTYTNKSPNTNQLRKQQKGQKKAAENRNRSRKGNNGNGNGNGNGRRNPNKNTSRKQAKQSLVDEASRVAVFQRLNTGIHKLANDFREQNEHLHISSNKDLLLNELFNYFDLNQDRSIKFDEFKVILQLLGVVSLT